MINNYNPIIRISIKIIILVVLLICIFNGAKISDFIYHLNVVEGYSEFDSIRLYISIQIILSVLSIFNIGLILVDYCIFLKSS